MANEEEAVCAHVHAGAHSSTAMETNQTAKQWYSSLGTGESTLEYK
jgi:hypothetical protein